MRIVRPPLASAVLGLLLAATLPAAAATFTVNSTTDAVDALVVCVRNDLCPALLEAAVEAGLPVIFEKPGALRAADLPGAGVWWDVAPAEVSETPGVAELRADYEQGLALQWWHG